MSGFAVDRRTALRERKALIKARFDMTAARRLAPFHLQDRDGEGVSDPCPACRSGGVRFTVGGFFCPKCHAQGDAVAWVQLVCSVSPGRALDLIEAWPEFGRLGRGGAVRTPRPARPSLQNANPGKNGAGKNGAGKNGLDRDGCLMFGRVGFAKLKAAVEIGAAQEVLRLVGAALAAGDCRMGGEK